MDIYYDCKTCGQPYGFGRMTFEPAECTRCDPPPPYVPEPSDFELGEQAERKRILAMKKEIINCVIDYGLTPEKYERVCNDIDALIKGENNV